MSQVGTPCPDPASAPGTLAGMHQRMMREYPAMAREHQQMMKDSPGMRADEPPDAGRRRSRHDGRLVSRFPGSFGEADR